jgi:hypothetical protein
VRNRWCLTNMQKCLILLPFVSYEAVRLWWWGGNCGVVSFGKTPCSRSIPTLASKSNRGCGKDLGRWSAQWLTVWLTNFAIPENSFTLPELSGQNRVTVGIRFQIGSMTHEYENALSPVPPSEKRLLRL